MRLVMTLRARNEADILDAQLAFHLNAGVDFVIATDHSSDDGTTDILESYARDGYVHVIRRDDAAIGADWVTEMARLAATEHGADWVINADADEFWWPRGATLKEVLTEVPPRYGVVRGLWRHFLPPLDGDGFFAEQMTTRVSPRAAMNRPNQPYRPDFKSAHRATPDVLVGRGNHDVSAVSLTPLRGWYPIEVLHFRIRSQQQAAKKFRTNTNAWRMSDSGAPTGLDAAGSDSHERGTFGEFYRRLGVDSDSLAAGLQDGSFVVDTRLRDVLRALRAQAEEGETYARPRAGALLKLPRPDVRDDAAYAVDVSALDEANGVRLQRRVDELERRLSALEHGRRWPRARTRLRRLTLDTST